PTTSAASLHNITQAFPFHRRRKAASPRIAVRLCSISAATRGAKSLRARRVTALTGAAPGSATRRLPGSPHPTSPTSSIAGAAGGAMATRKA
ncbi:MAG: hypothetical protein M3R06_07025, partial [Chloroflexota bacterium]|nr:hypothetical protein [Chloroflexota bacterium]